MKAKLLNDTYPKTYAVIFEPGDEVLSTLQSFADSQSVGTCQIAGIGAFSDAVLGYFDFARKDYRRNPLPRQTEVVTLLGDITCGTDGRQLHLHAVLADAESRAFGGHLLEAHVDPTLELIVTESPAHLHRTVDPATGLPLVSL